MRRLTSIKAASLAIITFLAGCGEQESGRQSNAEPPPPQAEADSPASPRTVSFFLAHPDDLKTAIERCRNDPGALGRTPECINAAEARKQKTADEMKQAVE